MVRLDRSSRFHDDLKQMVVEHSRLTGSDRADSLLQNWSVERKKFVRVIPVEYEKVMAKVKGKVKTVRLDQAISSASMLGA